MRKKSEKEIKNGEEKKKRGKRDMTGLDSTVMSWIPRRVFHSKMIVVLGAHTSFIFEQGTIYRIPFQSIFSVRFL